MAIRKGDRVRCSSRCDKPHMKETIGIVTGIANFPWPIAVEWMDGTDGYYDEVELEVMSE